MRRQINPLLLGVLTTFAVGACTNVPVPETAEPTVVTVTETEVVYVESDACIECVIEDVLSTYLEENFPATPDASGGGPLPDTTPEEGDAPPSPEPDTIEPPVEDTTTEPDTPEPDTTTQPDPPDTSGPTTGVEELTIDLNINAVSLSGLTTIGPIVTGGDVVLGVEFYVDGVRLDTDFIPPYSLVINTATYADGPHTITVYTADNTGQAANDQTIITFDNSPPEFTKTVPGDGAVVFYEDRPLTMELETDDVNSMELVRFRASGFLVGEFFNPPFFVQKAWEEIYVFEDQLPATVNVRFFGRDQLGLETEVTYNVEVHRRFAWQYENLGAIWTPAVAFASGNIAYALVNGAAGKFVILNPDGELVWEYDLGFDGAARTALVYDPVHDRVIVSTLGADLYAFNDHGNGVAWSLEVGYVAASQQIHGSLHYSHSLNAVLTVRNTSNGSVVWSAGPVTNQTTYSRLTIDPTTQTGYFGDDAGDFHAVDQSGLKWTKETGDSVEGKALVAPDGRVFVGSGDGFLYALNADGTDIWKTDVGGQLQNAMHQDPESGDIFIQAGLKNLTRVEDETGDELWSVPIEGWQQGTNGITVDDEGILYVSGALGGIFAVSPDDGEILWSMDLADESADVTDEQFYAAPFINNGKLYIGNENTFFYALNLVAPVSLLAESE
ncbi:MAG: PQQ-binding-like beta-propeller repeat protein [Myxococcota bacterium]